MLCCVQLGGYKLPFMVLGGALFLTSLSNCLFAPISRGVPLTCSTLVSDPAPARPGPTRSHH